MPLSRLRRDRRGGMLILFALAAVPLVLGVALALEVGHLAMVRHRLTASLDAAALAGARELRDGAADAAAEAVAIRYFNANFVDRLPLVELRTVRAEAGADRDMAVAADVAVDGLWIGARRLGGRSGDLGDVRALSKATYVLPEIEVALVLDYSGSMAGERAAAMRAGAKEFVGILSDNLGEREGSAVTNLWFSFVPYSTFVALPPSATGWFSLAYDRYRHDRSVTPVRCPDPRHAPNDASDTPPTQRFNERLDFGFGNYGVYAYHYAAVQDYVVNTLLCREDRVIEPLTNDPERIERRIDAAPIGGGTSSDVGLVWGWRTLSARWADGVWPGVSRDRPKALDPSDGNFVKYLLFMTDGRPDPDYEARTRRLRKICRNVRQDGIVIFAVGLQIETADQEVLRECVGSTGEAFFPETSAQLAGEFRRIASRMVRISLARN